jgi:hypothetical protein
MYFGSEKQELDVILDSGSSWVWLGSTMCTECANPKKFDFAKSKSFRQESPELQMLNYGRGMVMGYDTRDEVCLNPENKIGDGCMTDYKFKTVVYQEQLGGLHTTGLIGLAPSKGGTSKDEGAQLFVPSMYEQGAIKKNMFSMFIDQNKVSKIQIGGYNLKKYAQGPLTWYPIISETFWSMSFHSVTLGDEPLEVKSTFLMADTGTSLNMIPDEDYNNIVNKFFADKNCWTMPNSLKACECTNEEWMAVPDINFMIGEVQYTINRNMWYDRKGNTCVVKFMHGPGRAEWILGVNFFENYYTVFDYETQQIGLAKSINYGEEAVPFINWALAGTNLILLNLRSAFTAPIQTYTGMKLGNKILSGSILGAVALFAIYYAILKKSEEKKSLKTVRAFVVEDENTIYAKLN